MDCRDIQDQFSEYYDGDAQTSNVHTHLQNCEVCAAEYKRYAQLIDQVRALPNPEMPQGFHRNLMDYVLRKSTIGIDNVPISTHGKPINNRKFKIARATSYVTLAASIILALVVAGGVFDVMQVEEAPIPLGIMRYEAEIDHIEWTGEVPFAPAANEFSQGETVEFDWQDDFGDISIERRVAIDSAFEPFGFDDGILAFDYGAEAAGGGNELPMAVPARFDADVAFIIDEPISTEAQRHRHNLLIFVIGIMIVGSIGVIAITTAKLNQRS